MTTMELLKKARGAKGAMALADTELKNRALMEMARALEDRTADILAANVQDLEAARGTISEVMLARLALPAGPRGCGRGPPSPTRWAPCCPGWSGPTGW